MVCGLLVATLGPSSARGAELDELRVRYLISFATQMADTRRAQGREGVARACVLGTDPVGDQLMAAAQGASREGRAIRAGRPGRLEQVSGCDLLYIGRSEARRVEEVVARVGSEVLTVAAFAGFIARGGMVELQATGEGVAYDTSARGYELVGGTPRDLLAASRCAQLGRSAPRDPERVTREKRALIPPAARTGCVDQVRARRADADEERKKRTPRPPVPDEPPQAGPPSERGGR